MMRLKPEKRFWRVVSRLAAISLLLAFIGCAGTPARNPVPPELTSQVGIEGIPDARFWGDEWPKFALERLETYTDADIRKRFPGIYGKAHSYLAISGGGANGAFGAGLLAGWTASGTRPEFTMVTGISTGALTAPFAFLGPDYDDTLKEVLDVREGKPLMILSNRGPGELERIYDDPVASRCRAGTTLDLTSYPDLRLRKQAS